MPPTPPPPLPPQLADGGRSAEEAPSSKADARRKRKGRIEGAAVAAPLRGCGPGVVPAGGSGGKRRKYRRGVSEGGGGERRMKSRGEEEGDEGREVK